MALDKQMILSELGSVMNKLQSADCGCMGKLFSNQGQYTNQGGQGSAAMGSQLPTCGGCRRGCCHGHGYSGHGYSAPCAGEPYNNNPSMGIPCNPAKMYAETYNYLNSNLMQPVVKEVYQDLKSINPDNSVINNPDMARQMGLQHLGGGTALQENTGMAQNQMSGSGMGGMQNPNMPMNQLSNQPMSNQQMGDQQMSSQPMSEMGGMGPNILNMFQGDISKSGKTGQLTTPMATGAPQGRIPGVISQFGADNDATNYGGQQVQSQYMQQQNISSDAKNPSSRNAMGGNMQQNPGHSGATYQVNYSNPAAQQMSSSRGKQNYGQHTPGVTKFNEMFPGVMGGMSGDLGFDPMTIAIQMNPANQQQAAMGQMQKLMNGNPVDRVLDPVTNVRNMQPATTGANAAPAAMYQPPVNQQNVSPSNQQPMLAQPGASQPNQGYINAAANQPNQAQQQVYGQVPQQQQQAYMALTGAPMIQNQPPQQYQQQYQQQQPLYQQQQNVDPNAQQYQQQQQQSMDPYAPDLPNHQSSYITDPNVSLTQQPPQSYSAPPSSEQDQQMIKEPIFPVDTSKNQPSTQNKYQKLYDYNTLGQPVEMLPARMYHQAPETNQQQTLSPQPLTKMRTDQSRFTVKNTISKTSLMGSRPAGRTPSRSQLQHIYNQYKGSHSYTQQNIRSPGQGATFSEGKINVTQANVNQQRHVPVERVGGDTLVNNQMANSQIPATGQPMGHTGDVPMPVDNKPHGDIVPAALPAKKTRNGLQDMVYTSYPTSAKWSFHGNNDRSPYAPGYRFRRG